MLAVCVGVRTIRCDASAQGGGLVDLQPATPNVGVLSHDLFLRLRAAEERREASIARPAPVRNAPGQRSGTYCGLPCQQRVCAGSSMWKFNVEVEGDSHRSWNAALWCGSTAPAMWGDVPWVLIGWRWPQCCASRAAFNGARGTWLMRALVLLARPQPRQDSRSAVAAGEWNRNQLPARQCHVGEIDPAE